MGVTGGAGFGAGFAAAAGGATGLATAGVGAGDGAAAGGATAGDGVEIWLEGAAGAAGAVGGALTAAGFEGAATGGAAGAGGGSATTGAPSTAFGVAAGGALVGLLGGIVQAERPINRLAASMASAVDFPSRRRVWCTASLFVVGSAHRHVTEGRRDRRSGIQRGAAPWKRVIRVALRFLLKDGCASWPEMGLSPRFATLFAAISRHQSPTTLDQ